MKMILSGKKTFTFLFCAAFLLTAFPVLAQNVIPGQYNPKKERAEKPSDPAPVPKVFSKKISGSLTQALSLDALYHNLKISLWNYSQVDFTQQAVLIEKINIENFQNTRHKREFEPSLDRALSSLNANYKGMNEQIKKSSLEFEKIMGDVTPQDEELLRSLWAKEIKELQMKSDEYFKMQHSYVQMYQKLIAFILKRNGSYFFDRNTHSIKFYDVADYTFFAGTIDKLNAITQKQKKFLRDMIPNVDYLINKDNE